MGEGMGDYLSDWMCDGGRGIGNVFCPIKHKFYKFTSQLTSPYLIQEKFLFVFHTKHTFPIDMLPFHYRNKPSKSVKFFCNIVVRFLWNRIWLLRDLFYVLRIWFNCICLCCHQKQTHLERKQALCTVLMSGLLMSGLPMSWLLTSGRSTSDD